MGDAGEGWVDAEARIQERLEELRQDRLTSKGPVRENSEQSREIASLDLARQQLKRQLLTVSHPSRRVQLEAAIADLDRRIALLETPPG